MLRAPLSPRGMHRSPLGIPRSPRRIPSESHRNSSESRGVPRNLSLSEDPTRMSRSPSETTESIGVLSNPSESVRFPRDCPEDHGVSRRLSGAPQSPPEHYRMQRSTMESRGASWNVSECIGIPGMPRNVLNPSESISIRRNASESVGISWNPSEAIRIRRNPLESIGIRRNPSESRLLKTSYLKKVVQRNNFAPDCISIHWILS